MGMKFIAILSILILSMLWFSMFIVSVNVGMAWGVATLGGFVSALLVRRI